MRVTRRSLVAENIQLQAQLASTTHQSRRSLNRHVEQLIARNEDLVKTVQAKDREIQSIRADHAKATP